MSQYRHVMYISGSHLEQVFHERYERDIPIGTGSGVGVSPEIEGKLGALVGSLREHFASDVDRDGIKEINFDDELFQTKRVINDVLDDEGIPSVTELHGSNGNWEGMYRFSSEVLLQPYDGRFEDGKKFIKVKSVRWFTNMDFPQRHEDLVLHRKYNPEDYPHFDNYDAINVDVTNDIPADYDGAMGVPITFLDKYSPDQFEILGITDRDNNSGLKTRVYTREDGPKYGDMNRRGAVRVGDQLKPTYARLFIRKLPR